MKDFVHLHNHTTYSLLDGACRIKEIIEECQKNHMWAFAITDHGNMFGAVDFYLTLKNAGLTPIIGYEAYFTPTHRKEKVPKTPLYHLTLLAYNQQGYKNLIKLASFAYTEGFYYKPRIDKELLEKYREGLICLSGCIGSLINHYILIDDMDSAYQTAKYYKELFGKHYYLEIQYHNMPEEKKAIKGAIELSKKLDIPLVATNDIHYIKKEDAYAHEVLLCIQTKKTIDEEDRMKFPTNEFYFKTKEEMIELFKEIPEAIQNTVEIALMCEVDIKSEGYKLPTYQPPTGESVEEYLERLTLEGIKAKYNNNSKALQRAKYELEIINRMGFASYFLIVYDFVKWAKSNGITVGPGRGSGAGSIVAYALGITGLDPLKYDLLFERFLNPERVSMPDFDIDFCKEKRDRVIEYVRNKYGNDRVCQIIAFGSLSARNVVRDVGRVLKVSRSKIDIIAKKLDSKVSLVQQLQENPEIKQIYEEDSQIKQVFDIAIRLEGLLRQASTHAAGVVISSEDLLEDVPLYWNSSENIITTQYEMSILEKIGLVKMDFLGLNTLTFIDKTLEFIKKSKNEEINLDEISLEDPKTYELLSQGHTDGVFQMESEGMKSLLTRVKPNRFEDLIAIVALYRPGPIQSGMVDSYINRKQGKEPIEYFHPSLKEILEPTYGVIIYQEQVQRIANKLSNFSLGEADLLRRAMGKKRPEEMQKYRDKFVEGAVKNGVEKRLAEDIFNKIEKFAEYGFNKSHSTAYALIAYRTAYLKAHYPVEFMAALLSSRMDNPDKVVGAIYEAKRMGIKIKTPDINYSEYGFTIEGNSIRFGLGAIKNVGKKSIEAIIEARNKIGKFKDIYHFTSNVNLQAVNKQVIEALIKAGAMDSLDKNRKKLFMLVEEAIELGHRKQQDRQSGQLSLLDFSINEEKGELSESIEMFGKKEIEDWHDDERLLYEKEVLGFFITGHPLSLYEDLLNIFCTHTSKNLSDAEGEVCIGGIIIDMKIRNTRTNNEKMMTFKLEDLYGIIEGVIFPETYKKIKNKIRPDTVVFIKGTVDQWENNFQLIVKDLYLVDEAIEKLTKEIIIKCDSIIFDREKINKLEALFSSHKGRCPVFFIVNTSTKITVEMQVAPHYNVKPSSILLKELNELIGQGHVFLR